MANSKPIHRGAVITGGGSGICYSFAKQLYEQGYNVLICDIVLRDAALDWIKSVEQAPGPKVRFQQTDVTDWRQLETAFTIYDHLIGGTPTILCPGAGVYDPSVANFWNDQDESYYKVLRINLEHPIKMSRLAIRRWQQTSMAGTIVLISSVGAQGASPIVPLYQVSKHGISAFTRCMAKLQDMVDIRVVAVAPGPTTTALMEEKKAARFVDWEKDRLAAPESIAEAMIDVAFNRDEYPPGTVLEVTWPKKVRKVALLNDPGPDPGIWFSRRDDAMVDVLVELERDRSR